MLKVVVEASEVKAERERLSKVKCVECDGPLTFEEAAYIVRGEVWTAAEMDGYDAGYLHERCLEKRLGRVLTREDYHLRYKRKIGGGRVEAIVHPGFLRSPEYRVSLISRRHLESTRGKLSCPRFLFLPSVPALDSLAPGIRRLIPT